MPAYTPFAVVVPWTDYVEQNSGIKMDYMTNRGGRKRKMIFNPPMQNLKRIWTAN